MCECFHYLCKMCGFYQPSLHMQGEIPKQLAQTCLQEGAKCDPPHVVIAEWACSGLGARFEKGGAMALSLLPVPNVAGLGVVAVHPPTIRIGPERHNYVYRLHFPSGVYRCDRCSEWGQAGDRLFLFQNAAGPGPY